MSKIKAGIIGCGTIFPMHAYPLENSKDAALVAVCDINPDAAANAAKQFACEYYTDYKEMITNAGIDVVHICTPHYLHPEMSIYAANAKKHVLTEKPMAIDYKDALDMIKAAEENNVTLGVIFQNRYNNSARLVKNTLDSGKLGRIISTKLSVTWHRADEYYTSNNWRGKWSTEGGGVLINQAIHTFDLMRWFIDSDIEYLDAFMDNKFHKDSIEVEDEMVGAIKFSNGVISSFYAINYYGYDAPVQIELYCENGTVNLIGDHATILLANGEQLTSSKDMDNEDEYGGLGKGYWGRAHIKQISRFYECLKTGAELDITAKDVLKTQKMICDIYESAKNKKKII